MEGLVREMQDPESGVPVRSQKQFLTSIPSAFMGECHRYLRCGVSVSGRHGQDTTVGCLRVTGYDLIEWLMERLAIEESGTVPLRSCCRLLSAVPLFPSLARSTAQHAQPQRLRITTLSIVPLRIRICIDTFPLGALIEHRLYTKSIIHRTGIFSFVQVECELFILLKR